MGKITVVGSIAMDLIAEVEKFPVDGQTIIGKKFKTLPGGKGANQAVAAIRLGGSVEMIGMVGADPFGETLKKTLSEEGIETRHLLTNEIEQTALGLIQINAQGENRIVVIPGANYSYQVTDFDQIMEVLKGSDVVITQLEQRREVVFHLIELCHALGLPLILNPAPAFPIGTDILRKVAYLTPNETELSILSGLPVDTYSEVEIAIQALLSLGVGHVIATLGSNGAMLGTPEGVLHIPGYPVKVVDTVAAGDAFNGALAFGIANRWSLEKSVRYANAAGALTVTKSGAIPSLPSWSDVSSFLKSVEGPQVLE